MEEWEIKLWKKIVSEALSGSGTRNLSSEGVEFLISYITEKPYMLGRVEAKRIEPQFDRDMPNYSIYGHLPPSGEGFETDRLEMIKLFRKLNVEAQNTETYAMRYDVWLVEY